MCMCECVCVFVYMCVSVRVLFSYNCIFYVETGRRAREGEASDRKRVQVFYESVCEYVCVGVCDHKVLVNCM